MLQYFLVNINSPGWAGVDVASGPVETNSVYFHTPINLSAWANADGTANRKAKETMQAIAVMRVFIEPRLIVTMEKRKTIKAIGI